jgi:F420-0:gamma-glutamyl ligase-like protein
VWIFWIDEIQYYSNIVTQQIIIFSSFAWGNLMGRILPIHGWVEDCKELDNKNKIKMPLTCTIL